MTSPTPIEQEWISPQQVCDLLGISYQTLANWRYQGYGPVYTRLRPSKRSPIRYRRSDVEQWMTDNAIST
ncbi:helix-turn-helix domain-containing protein [Streptomyces albogriseolus]|nr:helix-turn-helix domain-containing protein [Streptomyces albogriseolus]